MFDFFDSLEKKRAFQRALKEVNAEQLRQPAPAMQAKASASAPATQGGQPVITPAHRRAIVSPFRRPETTAIDLKYFKDWRKVDTVQSNNPTYPKRPLFPSRVQDEEAELVKDENPVKPTSTASTIEKFGIVQKEQSSTDRDITEYLRALREERAKRHAATPVRTITEPIAPKKPVEEPKPAPAAETNDKIKVEVIDFGGQKEQPKPKPKPKTTRKPRGKNKRRFDADVISSVDWK